MNKLFPLIITAVVSIIFSLALSYTLIPRNLITQNTTSQQTINPNNYIGVVPFKFTQDYACQDGSAKYSFDSTTDLSGKDYTLFGDALIANKAITAKLKTVNQAAGISLNKTLEYEFSSEMEVDSLDAALADGSKAAAVILSATTKTNLFFNISVGKEKAGTVVRMTWNQEGNTSIFQTAPIKVADGKIKLKLERYGGTYVVGSIDTGSGYTKVGEIFTATFDPVNISATTQIFGKKAQDVSAKINTLKLMGCTVAQ